MWEQLENMGMESKSLQFSFLCTVLGVFLGFKLAQEHNKVQTRENKIALKIKCSGRNIHWFKYTYQKDVFDETYI